MDRRSLTFVLSLTAPFVVGCVATHWVRPSDLAKLEQPQEEKMARQTQEQRTAGHADGEANQPVPALPSSLPSDSRGRRVDVPVRPAAPRQLRDVKGETIDLTKGVKLYLDLKNGTRLGGDVSTSDVRNGQFVWKRDEGALVEIPLQEISAAHVDVPDAGKTVTAIFGAMTVLIGGGILWISLAAAHGHQ